MQKKGSAASGAAREKIAGLQAHASKVEDLLKSMQVSTRENWPQAATFFYVANRIGCQHVSCEGEHFVLLVLL